MKKTSRTLITASLMALAIGAGLGSLPAQAQLQGGIMTEAVATTVVAVDKATRTVTLKDATGNQFKVKVSAHLKNFDEIDAGDTITLVQSDALIADIQVPDANAQPGIQVSEEVDQSNASKLPSGDIIDTVTLTGKITAIDAAKASVTVEGPNGKTVTLPVQNPDHKAKLGNLKAGDLIQVTFIRATGISVTNHS